LVTLSDITKLKEYQIETEKKVYLDNLTQVYNRNKFDQIFEEELERAKRYHSSFTVAILDIDNFKDFNDAYGHMIGDEVLIKLAQTVNKSVRETDIFARWGGEEFVILFKNTSIERAKAVSLKLKNKIEENEHPDAGKITASFGLSEYIDGDTVESLFNRCDEALYRAKENGRNRLEVM
jgi:diguanylate cyclase (GGDEF)-like protein